MVWQETVDVAVIVMLTQTHDGTTEKCFQYFPLNAEAGSHKIEPVDRFGSSPDGSVTFLETTSHPDAKTAVRKFLLKFGAETRVVWHFLFSSWTDFAAPEDEDRTALLELMKASAEKNSDPGNPRIIHCSAGVGRSGTFIALEYLLAQLESGTLAEAKEGEDMVYDVVNQLREQRMMMVQQEPQFQFLYDVLREQLDKKGQSELKRSGYPSPKLRKLASGMKAAIIGEESSKDHTSKPATIENQVEEAKELSLDEERVKEAKKEGQAPSVS